MAVTIAEAVAEIVSTTNATTYNFGSFTPNTNRILVVIAMVRTTVATGSMVNVSGTSLVWHKIGKGTWNSGADTIYAYWAKTPGSTAASVYQVNVSGDTGAGCIAYMWDFNGAHYDSINPIRQIKFGANTASANPAVTFDVAMDTNNGYCAAWAGALSSSNPANVSAPPGSWTEIGDNGYGTPTTNGSGAYRAGGETGTSVTFTASSTNWGMVAIEVYNDGAGPLGHEFHVDRSSHVLVTNPRKYGVEPY